MTNSRTWLLRSSAVQSAWRCSRRGESQESELLAAPIGDRVDATDGRASPPSTDDRQAVREFAERVLAA